MPAWNADLAAGNLATAEQVSLALYQMPMASVADLAAGLGLSMRTIRTHIRALAQKTIVEGCTIAATHRAATRLHLTESAARSIGNGYSGWNDPWGLSFLLQHSPMVENFYQVAAQCCDGDGISAFQWIFGDAIDAAVRLNAENWIAMVWSGHWETEGNLYDRLLSVDADLRSLGVSTDEPSVPDPHTRPSALIFVASDLWQAELVRRAAFRAGMARWVEIFCAATGTWPYPLASVPLSTRLSALKSRGWIHWSLPNRDLAGWTWEKRRDDSLSTRPDGLTLHKALDLTTQWPGAGVSNLAGLGGGERLDRLTNAFDALIEAKMAVRVELTRPTASAAKPDVRYEPTSRAVALAAARDRVKYKLAAGASRALTWNDEKYRNQRPHEDLVIRVMAALGRKKRPVAPGWRCSERFSTGGITPDGMAFLADGPFGPGWHYVEVERRAASRKRVSNKLRGYAAPERGRFFPGEGEPPPVLFIVRNDRVEQIYHEEGAGIRMLTITPGRWNASAPMAGWSRFGETVRLW